MTPFRRLALIASGMLLAGALASVWAFVSWPVALCALLGGLVFAGVSTIELEQHKAPAVEAPDPESTEARPNGALRVVERGDIERRAAASRELDE